MLSVLVLHQQRTPARIPPAIQGRRGFLCPAQRMIDAGADNAARAYAHRRRHWSAQLRVDPFRASGDAGPWVESAFCSVCEALRRDCDSRHFVELPWAIDCRHRAMPIGPRGPLAPSRERTVGAMPPAWQQQVDRIAAILRREPMPQTKHPSSVPVDLLAANIEARTGRHIAPGVLLLGFLDAGCSFGVALGRAMITISGDTSLAAADRLATAIIRPIAAPAFAVSATGCPSGV